MHEHADHEHSADHGGGLTDFALLSLGSNSARISELSARTCGSYADMFGASRASTEDRASSEELRGEDEGLVGRELIERDRGIESEGCET